MKIKYSPKKQTLHFKLYNFIKRARYPFTNNSSVEEIIASLYSTPEVKLKFAEEADSLFQVQFKDVQGYKNYHSQQIYSFSSKTKNLLDFLIAYELFIQLNNHIDIIHYHPDEHKGVFNHPQLTQEAFFKTHGVTRQQATLSLAEYLLNQLPESFGYNKRVLKNALDYHVKYPETSFSSILISLNIAQQF